MQFQRAIAAAAALVLVAAAPAAAQVGVGVRLTGVHDDTQIDPDAPRQRFYGLQLRGRVSPRVGLELSIDRRSETSLDETTRVREYPVQGSLILFPLKSSFSPYFLGGVGWYTHILDDLSGEKVIESITTRQFGYHAGFGAELKMGKHAGVHADYRYTMLRFGDSDADLDEPAGLAPPVTGFGLSGLYSRFLPSYDGSMWTAGFTIYF
jgi:opacity protein-like surface antigen